MRVGCAPRQLLSQLQRKRKEHGQTDPILPFLFWVPSFHRKKTLEHMMDMKRVDDDTGLAGLSDGELPSACACSAESRVLSSPVLAHSAAWCDWSQPERDLARHPHSR